MYPGGPRAVEKKGESHQLTEQEKYLIAVRTDLRDAYEGLISENQGATGHKGSVRADIAKVDKEYKELQTEYNKLTEEQGNPSGKGGQQK